MVVLTLEQPNKQCHVHDTEYFTAVIQEEDYGDQRQRNSPDSEENYFAKLFLKQRTEFDLFIPNGAFDGDGRGHFAFVSAAGNNVIDYYAPLRSISHLPQKMCVEDRTDLQQMPFSWVLSSIDNVGLDSEFKPIYFERLI